MRVDFKTGHNFGSCTDPTRLMVVFWQLAIQKHHGGKVATYLIAESEW
jgi:hypothetical protein